MKKYGSKPYVLGVMVTSRTIDAVLLHDGPEGPAILRTFRRHRNTMPAMAADMTETSGMAGDESGGDFTIQFGDAGDTGADLFLMSEFDSLDPAVAGEVGDAGGTVQVKTFELELKDIIAECEDAGYADPKVAFCNGSIDVKTAELRTLVIKKEVAKDGESKKKKEKRKKRENAKAKQNAKPLDKGTLVERLAEQTGEEVDPERVAFLPMTPGEGDLPRYLAIIGKDPDPVVETVKVLRSKKSRMPQVRLLDNEISAYLGLARAANLLRMNSEMEEGAELAFDPLDPEPRKTLVVRAGVEDTLVMFLEEDTLQHFESLRSITTYDAPETICSRVLLLQDEYGTGEVQQVFLLGEEREETLLESFALFFPDAYVESLSAYLPFSEGEETPLERTKVLAVAAGLRLIKDDLYESVFPDVNLIPEKLLRRQFAMPVSWHSVALLVILFCTVLFFVYRYFTLRHHETLARQRLQLQNLTEVEADAKKLQARIDSMEAATAGYVRALDVLDSLLVGSDQWSRALEKTARETAAIAGGIWVESWRMEGQNLELEGNATSRDYVVSLADRLDASIRSLSFSEIREWPVFSFRMIFPIKRELPEAARYLREHVSVEDAVETVSGEGTPEEAAKTTAEAQAPAETETPEPTETPETPVTRTSTTL
ncbi:PilN domain-containing protein [Rhodocaloribacter sp.]